MSEIPSELAKIETRKVPNQIELKMPLNAHVHVRDDDRTPVVLPWTFKSFGGAIFEPNLKPPVRTVAEANAYRGRLIARGRELFRPEENESPRRLRRREHVAGFRYYMTVYLTDQTTPETIDEVADSDWVVAVKFYPMGATTNSDSGVSDLRKLAPVFERMQKRGVPLQLHAEVTDRVKNGWRIGSLDLERIFIDHHLTWLVKEFPEMRISVEHVTTMEAVQFVRDAPEHVVATVTPQHMIDTYDDMLRDDAGKTGLRPHNYCLPIPKLAEDLQWIVEEVATRANRKFSAGTDSAPHLVGDKECSCGCAGCFNEPVALSIYAEVFERHGRQDSNATGMPLWIKDLEAFVSLNARAFYRMEEPEGTIVLERNEWFVPMYADSAAACDDHVGDARKRIQCYRALEKRQWRIQER